MRILALFTHFDEIRQAVRRLATYIDHVSSPVQAGTKAYEEENDVMGYNLFEEICGGRGTKTIMK